MSFTAGVFSINTAGQPVVTGTIISSTAFNLLTADLATGLSTCVLKDGTQTCTATVPFANVGITVPVSALGTCYSATYTPTLTASANVDASTAYLTRYWRMGNQVMVSGRLDMDTTAGGGTATQLGISLPVASNFGTATTDCSGVANSDTTSTEAFGIIADVSNDRANLTGISNVTVNRAVYFTFTYTII